MAMAFKFILIYASAGLVSAIIFSFLILLLYRWKHKKPLAFKSYPSIVLTSHDSPQLKEKRLWSPPENKDEITKPKSTTKADRSEKARSYWFPKRDIIPFLAPTTGEYQQPLVSKQTDDVAKGRLKFSFSYDYHMKQEKSLLTVKLHHGRDYTGDYDDLSMDTFVKTRLLPSNRQTFTSKLQRRTLNPNYDETYQFDIEYSELSSQVLCFEVYRYDCVSRHNIFGEVIVPFKDLGSSGSGNVIKEISMSMNITDPDTTSSDISNNNAENIADNIKLKQNEDDVTGEDCW